MIDKYPPTITDPDSGQQVPNPLYEAYQKGFETAEEYYSIKWIYVPTMISDAIQYYISKDFLPPLKERVNHVN